MRANCRIMLSYHTHGVKTRFLSTTSQAEIAGWSEQPAYGKIIGTCRQALEDGLEYAWIDTCCIQKSSSSELSEAINSMFRWYRNSTVCYVYMADMPANSGFLDCLQTERDEDRTRLLFRKSRWFKRGWTLQELLAPISLTFFDCDWGSLGSLENLSSAVSSITGIDSSLLSHSSELGDFSVAKRMSWASKRSTTRVEDRAYSLLGLFDINMPMLYGEGEKAFLRLQEEIVRSSSDQSIFAWQNPKDVFGQGALFAPSVDYFTGCGNIVEIPEMMPITYTMSNRGLEIALLHPVIPRATHDANGQSNGLDYSMTVLNCRYEDDLSHCIALKLAAPLTSGERYIADSGDRGSWQPRLTEVPLERSAKVSNTRSILLRNVSRSTRTSPLLPKVLIEGFTDMDDLKVISLYPRGGWNPSTLTFNPRINLHGQSTAAICFQFEDVYFMLGVVYTADRYLLSLISSRAFQPSSLRALCDGLQVDNYFMQAKSALETPILLDDENVRMRVTISAQSRVSEEVYVASILSVTYKYDEYNYQALEAKNCIRLLTIRPSDSTAADVDGELSMVDLYDPKFDVLSSSWEENNGWDSHIRVHHGGAVFSLPLPNTLVMALKALRSKRSARQLWVETICVDHSDDNERNQLGKISP